MEYSIGIDIGGTKIAAGIVSRSGELVYYQSASTPQSDRHRVLSVIEELIRSCMQYAKQNTCNPIVGIGVCFIASMV